MSLIEGSGIGIMESELPKMPDDAWRLLKMIDNGDPYDQSSQYIEILEMKGYIKDGLITQRGKDTLFYHSEIAKMEKRKIAKHL